MSIRNLILFILTILLFSCKGFGKKETTTSADNLAEPTEFAEEYMEEEEIIMEYEDDADSIVYRHPTVRDTLIYGYFKQYDFWGQVKNPKVHDEAERMRYLQMYINKDTVVFDGRKDNLGLYKYLTNSKVDDVLAHIHKKYPQTKKYSKHGKLKYEHRARIISLGKAIESSETSTFDDKFAKSIIIIDYGKIKEAFYEMNREGIYDKYASSLFCKEEYYGEVTKPIHWTDFFYSCIKPDLFAEQQLSYGYKAYRFSDTPALSSLIANKDLRNEIDHSFWHYYFLLHNSNKLTCLLQYTLVEGAKDRDRLMPTLYTIYNNQVADSLHFNKYLTFTINNINDIQAVLPQIGDNATNQGFEATVQKLSISPQGKIQKGKTQKQTMRNDEVLLFHQQPTVVHNPLQEDTEWSEEEEESESEGEIDRFLTKTCGHIIELPLQFYSETSIIDRYGKGYGELPNEWISEISSFADFGDDELQTVNCYELLDSQTSEYADRLFLICINSRDGSQNHFFLTVFSESYVWKSVYALHNKKLTEGYKNTFEVVRDPSQGRDAIRISSGQMVDSKFRRLTGKVLNNEGDWANYRIPKGE